MERGTRKSQKAKQYVEENSRDQSLKQLIHPDQFDRGQKAVDV